MGKISGQKAKESMENKNYEYPDQKILDVPMGKRVQESFINYAMSVIMARALPDVRDGLKPVHRRILYAMYEDNLTYDKPFRKSATTVGNVLGRYHPHGDSAVYDTMVRLAQDFSLRYPLIEGHGNFGNIDGDGAAAYRYTEARMSRLANDMLIGIEKEEVDMVPNFDNKLKEPGVLPCRFPNLLVNGSMGIAVGMATNIPPHNIGEMIDGVIYLMDHPEAEITDLMEYVKGPDFPTGAMIYGANGIAEAYRTGHGKIMVRSRAEVDEENRRIVVTEIPYGVNKRILVEGIAECVKSKRIEGITALRDESGQGGLRVVIEYKRDVNGNLLLNQLYKYTQLQDTFAVNMLTLVNNEPKILNLKQMMQYYIDHQLDVVRRGVQFDLNKALREAHIFEGYKIAIDAIDEVISIIRASESVGAAKEALMERFHLSQEQAQAIVDMTLGKLSNMERQKVEERLAKLHAAIEEYRSILADEGKIKEIIRTDLEKIRARFGDARRTELIAAENEILLEDLIERHTALITMTHCGYIKRCDSDIYSAQNRGGKGLIGMTTKEEDFVERVIAVDSHSYVLFFTNFGKVHLKKGYEIPEASRTAKGSNIVNLMPIENGEKITAMLSVSEFDEQHYLLMVTKKGIVKRTCLCEYEQHRKGGKIAIRLDEGDELLSVRLTTGSDSVLIATHNGLATCFEEKNARVLGRTARGVRGIRLKEDDYVVGVCAGEGDGLSLITVTENGYGKRCDFSEFSLRNRGCKGVICHNLSDKTGLLAGVAAVGEEDDVMLITDDGTLIRTPAAQIPVYSRTASGVIVMRLAEEAKLVGIAPVAKQDSEDSEDREDAQ